MYKLDKNHIFFKLKGSREVQSHIYFTPYPHPHPHTHTLSSISRDGHSVIFC